MIMKIKKKNKKMATMPDSKEVLLDTSMAPIPTQGLNVGLSSGLTTDMYQETVDGSGQWSPYYAKGIMFAITDSEGTVVGDHFNNIISPLIISKYQRSVSKALTLPKKSIRSALGTALNAISTYYTIDSIIRITDNTSIKNLGLLAFREKWITPTILLMHEQLGRRLTGVVLPPRVVAMAREMFSVHALTDMPGSPVVQFGWNNTLSGDESDLATAADAEQFLSVGLIKWHMEQLEQWSQIYGLLYYVKNDWLIGDLVPAQSAVEYSVAFNTLWGNCGDLSADKSKDFIFQPQIDDVDNSLVYRTYDNTLDGSIVALSSIHLKLPDGSYDWHPGLVKPAIAVADADSTKAKEANSSGLVYFTGKEGEVGFNSTTAANTAAGVLWGTKMTQDPVKPDLPFREADELTLPGSDVVNVTPRVMEQKAYELLDVLYDTESLSK